MKLEFVITTKTTIKEFIVSNISRNFYGYLKKHNVIYLNNNLPVKPYQEVNYGDILQIIYEEDKNQEGILNSNPIDILYEDELVYQPLNNNHLHIIYQ